MSLSNFLWSGECEIIRQFELNTHSLNTIRDRAPWLTALPGTQVREEWVSKEEINARRIQALCSSLSHGTMVLKENINASNGREDNWHFIEDHKLLSNAGYWEVDHGSLEICVKTKLKTNWLFITTESLTTKFYYSDSYHLYRLIFTAHPSYA